MSLCDKCGKEVPMENDATFIQSLFVGAPAAILFWQARHFLPTADCEGSPSRAQYIEGQPRDPRGYEYEPGKEQRWRTAYSEAQEIAAAQHREE